MRRFRMRGRGAEQERITDDALPDRLGVYLLKRADGGPFFVGNSSSPRRRAAAYERSFWLAENPGIEFVALVPQTGQRVLVVPPTADNPHAAMADTSFWGLIAEARRDRWSEESLRRTLHQKSATECAAFAARWQSYLTELYTWHLWNVAYIMRGGCSDDAFEHFRSWIIAQGEAVLRSVQRDPVQWALGQVGSISRDTPMTAELESYVALEVYEEKSGTPLLRLWPSRGIEPTGDSVPEEEIYKAYPELTRAWEPNA
jgi:hypothetical protein